jgi:hypothetical protein
MPKLREKLTYANAMSTIAVVIAVAGGSTAVAVTVNASKKSDINKKGKIRPGRVTTKKLAGGAVSAAKLGAIQIVQETALQTATASCPSAARLLSGGGLIPAVSGTLVASRPDGNGWSASADTAANVTAYALCLR